MTDALLSSTRHRPWPIPETRWVMAQSWHDLLFAHWRADPLALQAMLPAGLRLDTRDGDAWVGVVPFRMSGVRLRGLPAVPGASAFPELNVRTYVVAGERPGVWFFSLDAASALAVAVARAWFRLPYFRAAMTCKPETRDAGAPGGPDHRGPDNCGIDYGSRRTHRGAPSGELRARYRPTSPPAAAATGTLAHWLTERYCLYAAGPRGLVRGDIHHAPWPLQDADAEIDVETVSTAAGLRLAAGPPLLHFARRLDVVCWAPVRV